ncbi:MAG: PorV/PorQ family protein [Phycisphaerae bacterium]|nr:PorV/PorQ family protein [Gemmatimonadaceae bacterium]
MRASRGAAVLAATLIALTSAPVVTAQASNSAALFLMQPVGARNVGHGEAAVADTMLGTDGIWWNPAGMARNRKREIAVHHGQAFFATSNLLAATYPSKALGTLGAAAFIHAYENGVRTDGEGNVLGVTTNRYYVVSASYATPMGKHFSAGLTAKYVMIRLLCGGCAEEISGNAGAVDMGAQYILPTKLPFTLGASVRNLGSKLRAKDVPQSDALPVIFQFGGRTRLPLASLNRRETTLDLMSDVVISNAYYSPSLRFGADLSYQENYALRVGYKGLSNLDGLERGLTAGLGFKYNSLQIDIARRFDASGNVSESAAPTFVSLRYVF